MKKEINYSLYRKILLLTYSRTTEQKLKDTYKTLKDIDNSIKQSEALQGEDKTQKHKNYSKRFKENKETVDYDINISYIIYVKFKGWYIINSESDGNNYQLFESDLGADIHSLWLIKQITLQTYGKKKLLKK